VLAGFQSSVGDAADDLGDDEIKRYFARILGRAAR
jgi:hypothetical protein